MMHQHASKTPRARRAPAGRSAARTATSARKRAANRRNARASTGPRTAAGKARVAQNARRHGLTVAVAGNPAYAREVEAMADAMGRGLADSLPSPPPMSQARYRHLVRRIAEAQIDVVRVRRARRNIHLMIAQAFAAPEGPQRPVPILADLVRQLAAVNRYQGRALSRRRRAIRAFDATCAETEHGARGRERERAEALRRNKATAHAVAEQSQQPGRRAGVSPAPSGRKAGGTPALRPPAGLAEQSQRNPPGETKPPARPEHGRLARPLRRQSGRDARAPIAPRIGEAKPPRRSGGTKPPQASGGTNQASSQPWARAGPNATRRYRASKASGTDPDSR